MVATFKVDRVVLLLVPFLNQYRNYELISFYALNNSPSVYAPVSYTHLDVYKRQPVESAPIDG